MLQNFEQQQPLEYVLGIFMQRELKYRNKIQKLDQRLCARDEDYRQLQQQHDQLKGKYQELQEDYRQMKWENSELEDKITELQCLSNIYSPDGDANCNWIDD
jgi:chromosome segregation ATPase